MKNFILFAGMCAAASAMAGDVDYSRCQQAVGWFGAQLNPKGELVAGPGMQASPDIKTVAVNKGQQEVTYTFKSQMRDAKGKAQEFKYKVVKDENGNIVEINTAQDQIDPEVIKMQKKMMLESAVWSGLDYHSMPQESIVKSGTTEHGGWVEVHPLKDITKEDAKKMGVDLDELRALKKQNKKDHKSLDKIRNGYAKLMEKSHPQVMNGNLIKTQVVDGVCQPKSIAPITYDSKTKKNQVGNALTAERCAHVIKVQNKYQAKLNECYDVHSKMNSELADGNTSGSQGGAVGGSIGGVAGGGYVGGGMGGGYGMGYPGMGMGYAGYGLNEAYQCQWIYSEPQSNPYNQGGFGHGSGSGKGVGF